MKNNKVHPVSEKRPASVRVFRVKAVTGFLKSGIVLNKLDSLCELFEETGLSLSSSQHLRELIPLILEDERNKICEKIKGAQLHLSWAPY